MKKLTYLDLPFDGSGAITRFSKLHKFIRQQLSIGHLDLPEIALIDPVLEKDEISLTDFVTLINEESTAYKLLANVLRSRFETWRDNDYGDEELYLMPYNRESSSAIKEIALRYLAIGTFDDYGWALKSQTTILNNPDGVCFDTPYGGEENPGQVIYLLSFDGKKQSFAFTGPIITMFASTFINERLNAATAGSLTLSMFDLLTERRLPDKSHSVFYMNFNHAEHPILI